MDEAIRIVAQWLHVTAGVLWIGGGSYTLFVQLPGLLAAPAQARGPVLAQLAPRQVFYLLRVAELTLATGLLQIVVTGRGSELIEPLGSRWAGSIVLGIVGALTIYVLIQAAVKPTVTRMLAVGPRVASGDPAAPAEAAALVARMRALARTQVTIGIAVIFLMVLARFS